MARPYDPSRPFPPPYPQEFSYPVGTEGIIDAVAHEKISRDQVRSLFQSESPEEREAANKLMFGAIGATPLHFTHIHVRTEPNPNLSYRQMPAMWERFIYNAPVTHAMLRHAEAIDFWENPPVRDPYTKAVPCASPYCGTRWPLSPPDSSLVRLGLIEPKNPYAY